MPREEDYNPLPQHIPLPSPDEYFNRVKECVPTACALDSVQVRRGEQYIDVPMEVSTAKENMTNFVRGHTCDNPDKCTDLCFDQFCTYIEYTKSDIDLIEVATRGQHKNKNWHNARKFLLTSSNFHTILHTRDPDRQSATTSKGSSLNEQYLPGPIIFGRKYEDKARQMFIKAHRHQHKKCTLLVPGLMISTHTPYLAASPDGIMTCISCGSCLIEVKCLWSKRHFHPKIALNMLGICDIVDGNLQLKKSHPYYTQIQGQMGCTDITVCYLVAFTQKGIHSVKVEFDHTFWTECETKLVAFYKSHHYKTLYKMCK